MSLVKWREGNNPHMGSPQGNFPVVTYQSL